MIAPSETSTSANFPASRHALTSAATSAPLRPASSESRSTTANVRRFGAVRINLSPRGLTTYAVAFRSSGLSNDPTGRHIVSVALLA